MSLEFFKSILELVVQRTLESQDRHSNPKISNAPTRKSWADGDTDIDVWNNNMFHVIQFAVVYFVTYNIYPCVP